MATRSDLFKFGVGYMNLIEIEELIIHLNYASGNGIF